MRKKLLIAALLAVCAIAGFLFHLGAFEKHEAVSLSWSGATFAGIEILGGDLPAYEEGQTRLNELRMRLYSEGFTDDDMTHFINVFISKEESVKTISGFIIDSERGESLSNSDISLYTLPAGDILGVRTRGRGTAGFIFTLPKMKSTLEKAYGSSPVVAVNVVETKRGGDLSYFTPVEDCAYLNLWMGDI